MKGRIKNKDLKVMTFQISSMMKSGCDIIEIFDTLISSWKGNTVYTLIAIKNHISSGNPLSDSFSVTDRFSPFMINMIYAGEESGNIDYVFRCISDYYGREDRIGKKIMSISIYPAILMIAFFTALNFIFLFVIPNFKGIADFGSGEKMPVIFRISDFMSENLLLISVAVFFTAIYIIYSVRSNKNIIYMIDRMKFRIPGIRELNSTVISEKFSRTLFILYRSGVDIEKSIEISSKVAGNTYFSEIMNRKGKNISGNGITEGLKNTGLFPPLFISMLKSGEESGNFDKSLKYVSSYYEEKLDYEIEKFMKLIEPLILVFMGLMIGFILVSVLSPMFDMINEMY